MNDDEVLARILRRFLVSDDLYWGFGVDPDGDGFLELDGSVILTVEEVETLRTYNRKPE